MPDNVDIRQQIIDALSRVYDPEIPVNIVDLGLIYGMEIDSNINVVINMTMTTRDCPVHAFITEQAKQQVQQVDGIGQVSINLVWDPPWTPGFILEKATRRQKGADHSDYKGICSTN